MLRARPSLIVAVLVVCGLTFEEASLAQTPVIHWTFDESAGGTTDALDTGSGDATTGALGATATRTSDTPGGGDGFSLDLSDPTGAGLTNSIVDGGNPVEVDTLAQLTLSTWLKVTSETDYNEGGSANVRLLAKQGPGPLFDGFTWNLTLPQGTEPPPRSNNAFGTGLFIGGQTAFAFSFATENILDRGGDWIFLAVTYDGDQVVDNTKFYIGDETSPVVQLGSTATIAAGPVFSTNTTNGGATDARFTVGLTDAAATADTSLTGFQDDARVYDTVLDLAAIEAVRLANLPEVSGVTGDYNQNDVVDAADYTLWRDNLNTALTLPNEDPAATPGMVTIEDYNAWKAAFGNIAGSSALVGSAIPEPGAVALAAAALSAAIGAWRPRRTKG